jgi:hypothetical protein
MPEQRVVFRHRLANISNTSVSASMSRLTAPDFCNLVTCCLLAINLATNMTTAPATTAMMAGRLTRAMLARMEESADSGGRCENSDSISRVFMLKSQSRCRAKEEEGEEGASVQPDVSASPSTAFLYYNAIQSTCPVVSLMPANLITNMSAFLGPFGIRSLKPDSRKLLFATGQWPPPSTRSPHDIRFVKCLLFLPA